MLLANSLFPIFLILHSKKREMKINDAIPENIENADFFPKKIISIVLYIKISFNFFFVYLNQWNRIKNIYINFILHLCWFFSKKMYKNATLIYAINSRIKSLMINFKLLEKFPTFQKNTQFFLKFYSTFN